MADQETNQDLDLGEEKSGKKKLIIIIAIVVLLLIGGGVAAYFLLAGDEETDTSAAEGESVEEQEKTESDVEKGPAQYYDMDPVFVVNLPGKPSLLQVGVNVRVTSDQMVEFLKHNDPMLRHHLLNLLQAKDAKNLVTRAAKEALQTEMLDEVNRIVKELSGPGKVDALYFTSFVMQ
ncbi:MAG: flagellar basal body-associated FliL family protein [Pseudomonadota bacterium]